MLDPENDFNDRNLASNEVIIAKAIEYLKYHDPANANRDYAIGLLKRMQHAAIPFANAATVSFDEFIEKYNNSND